jgi:nucleoside phosphorylase
MPLIRGWQMRTIEHDGRRYRIFESGNAALICGGIGAEAARRATEAVIQAVSPERVLSVGFAGALDKTLHVGQVIEPGMVINAADGARTEVGSGAGTLVSTKAVADKDQKSRLAKAYGANAVDMEAAAVAQGAEARGVGFGALKAISDAADFSLPAIDRFVAVDGTFQSVRFVCYAALRPWLWGSTMALARNSAKASHALCGALADYLRRQAMAKSTLPNESLIVGMNQN